jgi:hypothetical protein
MRVAEAAKRRAASMPSISRATSLIIGEAYEARRRRPWHEGAVSLAGADFFFRWKLGTSPLPQASCLL